MKKIMSILILFFLMAACSPVAQKNESIFRYKNSYVGDNSAVGNIIGHVGNNDTFSQFALSTTEEPYGITITYTSISPEEMLTTSTYLLSLISNAQWVAFELPNQNFKITRHELEEYYGQILDFENEQQLKTLLQENVNSGIFPTQLLQ